MGYLYRPKLKSAALLLLAWWFLMLGPEGQDRLVGPFKTAADCGKVRAWAEQRTTIAFVRRVSECWEG
jgi:hypothetical protein